MRRAYALEVDSGKLSGVLARNDNRRLASEKGELMRLFILARIRYVDVIYSDYNYLLEVPQGGNYASY